MNSRLYRPLKSNSKNCSVLPLFITAPLSFKVIHIQKVNFSIDVVPCYWQFQFERLFFCLGKNLRNVSKDSKG